MPLTAILRHDLRTLIGSWFVRLWAVAVSIVSLLVVSGNWATFQTAPLVASLLFPFLVVPWFLVVILLGVTPVTGARAESLADGILSRPVTRYEYMLASWAARVFAVLAVFLVGVVPWILLVALAQRPQVPEDTVTVYGIVASLGLVSLVLTLLVSLGFLLGTLLRNTLVTLVVLIFFWFPFGVILNVFSLEEFSPISLNRALPTLLRQPWREAEEGPDAVALDRGKEIEAMADQAAKFFSVFSGAPKERPKAEPKFFNADEYDDFSLFRVTLGYGIPTLLSVILAMAVFSWRDL